MKYSIKIIKEAISQWRDAYIDYDFLKIFVAVIRRLMAQRKDILNKKQQLINGLNNNYLEQSMRGTVSTFQPESVDEICNKIKVILVQINTQFNQAFEGQGIICLDFCQIKFDQIDYRHNLGMLYSKKSNQKQNKQILVPYIEYNYMEATYLSKMCQSNIEAERKIIKKHKKYANNQFQTHSPIVLDILQPLAKKLDSLIEHIQNLYVDIAYSLQTNKKIKPKQKREYLRSLSKNVETTHKQTFTLGLFVGVFVAVVTFMSLLLVYKNKSVETDPTFNRDFPTWRGISLIIFYIWILGIDVYCYQKYMVSHQMALQFNDNHKSSSTTIFKLASFFSTLFAVMFSVYALHLSGVATLYYFPPRFLVLFVWGPFILFMINPFPFIYYRSRRFLWTKFFKIFYSPFVGVPFVISFTTSQLVTLITPFQDLSYTVCYFTSIDFSTVQTTNICKNPAKLAVFIYSAIFLSYKFIQCIRQGYDKKKYFFQSQFWNSVKYLLSILTLVLSYLYKNGNTNIFAAWLTFTIIVTIYSYYWDLTQDWSLLRRHADHLLLRNKISYPKKNYYFMMIFGLFLRFAWILTLSPNILQKYFGSPEIFRLVTGTLQILRRGNWNIIRVQKVHLKNCDEFRAIPTKRTKLQKQIVSKLKQKNTKSQKNRSLQLQNGQKPQSQQEQIGSGTNLQKTEEPPLTILDRFDKQMKYLRERQSVVEDKIRQLYKSLLQKQKQADALLKQARRLLH